jgi:hypothetical protein
LPLCSLILAFLVPALAPSQSADRNDQESILVLVRALNPLDGVAVVETSSGRLRTVHVGDVIDAYSAKVTKVLADRLVLERVPGPSSDLATIWLYRGESFTKPPRPVVFAREAPTNEVVQPGSAIEAEPLPVAGAAVRAGDEKPESGETGSNSSGTKKKQR